MTHPITQRQRVCGVAALLVSLWNPLTVSVANDAGNSPAAAPLTLDRSIQLALQSHPDIVAAAAQLEQARGAVDEAVARRSLPISIAAGPSVSRGIGGGNATAGFASFSLQAGYDLDIAGRRKLAVAAAAKNLQASQADLEGARRIVAQAVVDAYFDVLRQQRALAVAQQGLQQDQNELQRSQALFKEELVPRLDTVKAEAQVARSQQSVLAAQGQLTAASASLRSLLGLPPDASFTLAEADGDSPLTTPVNSLVTQALAASPEIRSLDAQIAEAEVEIKQAATLRKPDLSVQANHLLTSDPADYRNRTDIGLVAAIGLDDWHAEPAMVAQARARLKALQAQRQETERQLRLAVLRRYLDLQSQQALVAAGQKALAAAEENARLTQVGYDAQVNTMKEVLDAQTELTGARAAYWTAVYDADDAAAALRILTGTARTRFKSELTTPLASPKQGDAR